MELDVKNAQGEVVGKVEVSDALFAVPMNHALVHQALVIYRQNQRQGTHKAKTRGEVSGGGRKPWRQKHTGRARQGSTRAPQWRHGGVAFGPVLRSHRGDLPRRMRHQALRCVLSQKARDARLVLVDQLELPAPATRAVESLFKALQVKGSVLIVTSESNRNAILSAHNLDGAWTLPVALLNAAELLKRDTVLITMDAVRKAEELWASERPRPKPVLSEPAPAASSGAEPVAVVEEPPEASSPQAEEPPPARRRRRSKE